MARGVFDSTGSETPVSSGTEASLSTSSDLNSFRAVRTRPTSASVVSRPVAQHAADTKDRILTRPPSQSVSGISQHRNNSTFRLAAYGLGISDSQLYSMAIKPSNKVSFYICFDYQKEQLSVFGKKDNHSLTTAHTRSFRSIKQVVLNEEDTRHFSLYFNDSKPVAQCLAMNGDEGRQLKDLLSQLTRRERYSRMLLGNSAGALYSGYADKRGKMTWSQRWLVVKPYKLEIFRTKDDLVPVTTIALVLSRVQIERHKKHKRQLVVRTPEKKYTFRVLSEPERDTVIELMRKAGEAAASPTIPITPSPSKPSISPIKLAAAQQSRSATKPSADVLAAPTPVAGTRQLSPSAKAAMSDSKIYSVTPSSPNVETAGIQSGSPESVPIANARGLMNSAESIISSSGTIDRREVSRSYDKLLQRQSSFKPVRNTFESVVEKMASESRVKKIEFIEEVPSSEFRPLPQILRHGVYSLMDVLRKSMTEGAIIAPHVHVPRAVWYQQYAKFQAYNQKVESFEMLQQQMLHMEDNIVEDVNRLQEVLLEFRLVTEDVQNRLSQHLSFVHSVKNSIKDDSVASKRKMFASLRKKMTRGVSMTSMDKVNDSTRYIRLLTSILSLSGRFSKWINIVERSSKVQSTWSKRDIHTVSQHLDAISEFFHAVVCNVVLHDMKSVLKRYMKHCSRSLIS
jgi:hypothetical protein